MNAFTKYLMMKGAKTAQFELMLFDQEVERLETLCKTLRDGNIPKEQLESQVAFIVLYDVMAPEFAFRALEQIHASWVSRLEGKRLPMILLVGNRDFDIDNVAKEQGPNISRDYRCMFMECLSASNARVFENGLKKLAALRLLQDEGTTSEQ